jgi:hypothetical protein
MRDGYRLHVRDAVCREALKSHLQGRALQDLILPGRIGRRVSAQNRFGALRLAHHADEPVVPVAGETAMRIHLQKPWFTPPQPHRLGARPARAFALSPRNVQDAEAVIIHIGKGQLVERMLPADSKRRRAGLRALLRQFLTVAFSCGSR